MAYVISDDCIACGTCIDECPVGAISEGDKYSIKIYRGCSFRSILFFYPPPYTNYAILIIFATKINLHDKTEP